MRRRIGMLLMMVVLCAAVTGCCNQGRRGLFRRHVGFGDCNCNEGFRPLPRARLTPTPAQPLPAGPEVRPAPEVDPGPFAPPPVEDDRIPPVEEERWRPTPRPEARLLPPTNTIPAEPETRLSPPEIREEPEKAPEKKPDGFPEPPEVEERPEDEIPDLDLPGFAVVKPNIATGQKPFPEGVKKLRDKGYKTILHIMPPEKVDVADRNQFESKGFRYVSLKVSPRTLDRQLVDELNHILTDSANHPIYVIDEDGSLVGALWYLHFRIIDRMGDAEALRKARQFGLNETEPGTQLDMWLAVQRFLEQTKNP